MSGVEVGLTLVRKQIAKACERAQRAPESVRLIAVSKRKPAAAIREAYALGQRDFGENYMQELEQKADELSDLSELRWHMIGHLQRNKARHLTARHRNQPVVLHTADNLRLLEALEKRLAGVEVIEPIPILLEVNVAGETQKSGCSPADLPALVQASEAANGLQPEGLMTVPPACHRASEAREHFRRLRELKEQHCPSWPRLSMGMSNDFDVAIEEGATDVRVGTAIFGSRD